MHGLADERHERREQAVDGLEALVERQVRRLLVRAARGFPEAPAVAAHVPVAELVDEALDRGAGAQRIVVVERRRRRRDRLLEQRQDPAIDLRAAARTARRALRSKPSSRAYITKNAYVFQNVLMKLLATSAMISTETRFCTSGATRAVKCQRSASAPTALNTS